MSTVVALGILALLGPIRAGADPPAAFTWEPTGQYEGSTGEVIAPMSGALFARVDRELRRSDDAGETWRTVSLPGEPGWSSAAAIDPRNHTRLYVYGAVKEDDIFQDRLFRSRDDTATWEVSLGLPDRQSGAKILVSPAVSGLVYLDLGPDDLRRSDDGGDTWVDSRPPLPPVAGPRIPCGWNYQFLPHPTRPDVLFRVARCGVQATHDSASQPPYQIDRSDDRGQTWTKIGESRASEYIPKQLFGRGSTTPSRVYRLDDPVSHLTGSSVNGDILARSDDGGETWTPIRDGENGGAEDISAVACDPSEPDRLYLVRQDKIQSYVSGPIGLRASSDGGQSWTDLGLPEGMKISHLAVGIDGRFLFAGTANGVWRLQLNE